MVTDLGIFQYRGRRTRVFRGYKRNSKGGFEPKNYPENMTFVLLSSRFFSVNYVTLYETRHDIFIITIIRFTPTTILL